MSAPLPPLHALTIVHQGSLLRPAPRARAAQPVPALARLWAWLMAPIDHGTPGDEGELGEQGLQPRSRAQLLARLRRQELARLPDSPRC
jgi:hypothetical protein